ncbi:hypothetical protein FIBSPDRAFT_209117 [Athelia psychrophila]|uniref:Uncharacterized protein n=1 Tax=Athelia psychrophila TaxID=1759441 RepID=A0A166WQ61_9AGAM|nr:hypothetical protein FIBSPDRAFT_209117 [Fibularhizoctonia sp. CBS 109695]
MKKTKAKQSKELGGAPSLSLGKEAPKGAPTGAGIMHGMTDHWQGIRTGRLHVLIMHTSCLWRKEKWKRKGNLERERKGNRETEETERRWRETGKATTKGNEERKGKEGADDNQSVISENREARS